MWPEYLLERAKRTPPEEAFIIQGSTPVVSFGHPIDADVATLGINPSSAEFLGRDGALLQGEKRRLATLDSLNRTYENLDQDAAAQIVDDCASYFTRRPYHWFNVLDRILSSALGVSYQDGSASHLDLVQWATNPIWKGIPDTAKARLLSDDRPFLVQQLQREGYRLIVVAGRTAMAWIQKAGLVRWMPAARLEGTPSATFAVGDTASPRFLGWSCNLQSQPGAQVHIASLVELLGRHTEADAPGEAPLETGELIPKGTHFRSREDLLSRLEGWLQRSVSSTIGDVSRFPRAPWLSFESPLGIVDINADTQRAAIEQMIERMRANPYADWYVVRNRRGQVNKVIFSHQDSTRGWYVYLRTSLPEPAIMQDKR